jgi:signal transduction histidine kinase
MKLWPRTLGVQLIVVTAVAVFLSNAAVTLWFELGNERLSETELIDRSLERAAAITSLMTSIPDETRAAAAETLNGKAWHFTMRHGPLAAPPMSPKEAALAARLKAMLPFKCARHPVTLHFIAVDSGNPKLSKRALEMILPVTQDEQLRATFILPAGPVWPTELMLAALVAIIVSSIAGAYIARRVARPLSKLAAAAGLAAMGETAPRVPEVGPDDVRNAAHAFNAMTDQVRRTLESQRQLLSAVGHDLRTPITAMRINIEFVEDAELRERLQKNLDELQDLTEAVLSAARGAGGEARRQVDLSCLVESVCADLDDLGEPVEWSGHPPAPLYCRANEVRRAVRNLVENAVAYGKKATVSMREAPGDPGAYEVVVDDEGPGIAPEDRLRVFEPFVRLEGSRNVETGGAGLGLTLVKAIAEGHGGKVILEDGPPGAAPRRGGLRAVLHLPRSAPAKPA